MVAIPLLSCAIHEALTISSIVAPLLGAVIVNVGSVKSSMICVDPVIMIPLAMLVKVVVSVFVHSLDVSTISVYAVSFSVHANMPLVSPCMIYQTGSVIYISQFTNGVLVYNDGNCSRALNHAVHRSVSGVSISIHTDGSPLHIHPLST